MSFALPFALLKFIDPLERPVQSFGNSLGSAMQYSLNSLYIACRFQGNSGSLATAFTITGLGAAVLNMITIEIARREHWRKESLKVALATEDFICDAALMTAIATVKSLEIARDGLYVLAGLVALDAMFAGWDYFRYRRVYKLPSVNPAYANEGANFEGREVVDDMIV